MIPLAIKENVLDVGMVFPEDLKAKEVLKFISRQRKFSYQIFLITLTDFNELLKKYRSLKKEVGKALEQLEEEQAEDKIAERGAFGAVEVEKLTEDAPISKVVMVILRNAVEGGASDIHIEPGLEKIRVRYRVLGNLHSSLSLPLKIHPAVIARIKILSNLRIDETRAPQDGRFSIKIDDKKIDFRVSTFPTILGEKVAIRILDPTTGLKKFEELGLTGPNFEKIKKAIKKPYGMILATGPTGCGKTTTLYAILQILNKEGVNVMTLEDPIEYFVEGINQSQVRPEIGYTFATGLRHMLRQDPNIIMVGEIRDKETASLAIHAALTGHIMLSSIHTTTSLGIIPRLIDLGIEPFLIAPTLSIGIAQRLLRTLCPFCKKEIKPLNEVQDLLSKEIDNLPLSIKKELKISSPFLIYQAVGCKKCKGEGYRGRIAVYEILLMTEELAEISLKEPSELSIGKEARRQEMLTMKQDGILKVLEGTTTLEEVLRVAEEK